jgi:hypothetical protein
MSQEDSVVCLYPTVDAAEKAVRKLGQGGFPIQQVSILTKDLGSEKKVHGFVTPCDVAKSAARIGAWVESKPRSQKPFIWERSVNPSPLVAPLWTFSAC